MELTKQQRQVLVDIDKFMQDDTSVFILKGYAGTGKTTMIKQIADFLQNQREVLLMAPTGRAARVLQEKTHHEATTIHRAIYGSLDAYTPPKNEDLDDDFKFHFPINQTKNSIVAIVDEASMLCSRTVKQELFSFGTDNLLDDLLTFVRPTFGGKIIFVGDPAQLPPVGENVSNALNPEFFKEKGLKVMMSELTEVLRQNDESVILKDAMIVRNLLNQQKRNSLVFETKEGEVNILPPEDFIPTYMEEQRKAGINDGVVICFSNQSAAKYNKQIRSLKYKEENPLLKVGDTLMVVQNNYLLDRMNGEFVPVLSIGKEEQISAPVYVQVGGSKVRREIKLTFLHISVNNSRNERQDCLLLLDLLTNERAALTIEEQKALYINFRMRNKNLKPGTSVFSGALSLDPYFNCLKAKYGYAVTGHKCQGGEWGKVFVDYSGRTGLSDDCLRWAYTATTRAKKVLYVTNLPHITPFSKFHINPIQKCSKIGSDYRVLVKVEKSPFHSNSSPNYLHAKCKCILQNLEYSPYSVREVISKPYLEIYSIETPTGVERYDLYYKGDGIFNKAIAKNISANNVLVKMMLDDERGMPIILNYVPSDEVHKMLYELIRSACDSLDIFITNVVEYPAKYYVQYFLRTSGVASYLRIFVDGKGFVKSAQPMSLLGVDDSELVSLIEEIKKHFV